MDSPSRNPLLLEQNNDTSDEDSTQGASGTISEHQNNQDVKESYRRNSSAPTDYYNFAYIAFYILGM
jgi:hypothetical protein